MPVARRSADGGEEGHRDARAFRAAPPRLGGAWKVAYADLTTAMMGLFLVLWLVNQSPDVRAAVAGYFQDPIGAPSHQGQAVARPRGQPAGGAEGRPLALRPPAGAQALERTAFRLEQAVSSELEYASLAPWLRFVPRDGGIVITLAAGPGGPFSAAALTPAGRALVEALGTPLAAQGWDVVLEGEAAALLRDEEAARGPDGLERASARAHAVRRALLAGGLVPGQVRAVEVRPAEPASEAGEEAGGVTIRLLPPELAPR